METSFVRIYGMLTKDRALDISDMFSLDEKRHKVAVSLISLSESGDVQSRVRHYLDVSDAKLVCYDILNGLFSEWTDHKGTPSKDDSGSIACRILTIRKDAKYRQPYVLKIDNGAGEMLPGPNGTFVHGGAVKMVETADSLTFLMSEWNARKMAQTVLDYIRDWETVHLRKRQEAQRYIVPLPADGDGEGADYQVPPAYRNSFASAINTESDGAPK